jgi:hypothetical protein
MTPGERAARLSRIPGMTIRAAASRMGVPEAAVRRARRAVGQPGVEDLLLAALTDHGRVESGPLPDLAGIAAWIDYVNHDGATAADVRARLDALVASGALRIADGHWSLARPWP